MARRRSSKAVPLTVVSILAAAFVAGCGEEEEQTAYCVDEAEQIVDSELCDEENDRGLVGAAPFFWYFGGSAGSRGFVRGERISGGERIAASDRAALATRGGFGSTGRASGSSSGVGRSFSSGGFSGGG